MPQGVFVDLELERAEAEPAELPGFLYEIQIDRNEIAGMGLSGVGVPFPEDPVVGANTAKSTEIFISSG